MRHKTNFSHISRNLRTCLPRAALTFSSPRGFLSPFSQGEAGQAINLPTEKRNDRRIDCAPHRAVSGKINVYIERADLCKWRQACSPQLRAPTVFSERSAFHVHIRPDKESQHRTRSWLRPSVLDTDDSDSYTCPQAVTKDSHVPYGSLKVRRPFWGSRLQCFSGVFLLSPCRVHRSPNCSPDHIQDNMPKGWRPPVFREFAGKE